MTYLVVAYAVFWVLTFLLVFSVFIRQRGVEQEMVSLRAQIEQRANRNNKDH